MDIKDTGMPQLSEAMEAHVTAFGCDGGEGLPALLRLLLLSLLVTLLLALLACVQSHIAGLLSREGGLLGVAFLIAWISSSVGWRLAHEYM